MRVPGAPSLRSYGWLFSPDIDGSVAGVLVQITAVSHAHLNQAAQRFCGLLQDYLRDRLMPKQQVLCISDAYHYDAQPTLLVDPEGVFVNCFDLQFVAREDALTAEARTATLILRAYDESIECQDIGLGLVLEQLVGDSGMMMAAEPYTPLQELLQLAVWHAGAGALRIENGASVVAEAPGWCWSA